MLDNSDQSTDVYDHVFITLFGCITGLVFVLVILVCVCWMKKSSTRKNETSDGYQDIRESGSGRVQFANPFRKTSKAFANGSADPTQLESFPAISSIPHSRFHQFPAAPLPAVPISSTPSTSVIGIIGRGTLTRESSTSELYASVDRNPAMNDENPRRRSSESRDDGGNGNEEHTYSKIRPPPGTYDEIDDVDNAKPSKRPPAPTRPPVLAKVDDADPFYSPLDRSRPGKSVNAPPPVPRLPLLRSAHPYDYPRFMNGHNRERWNQDCVDARTSAQRRNIPTADTVEFMCANGDAVYSKIDSQYGGSEDPYSSIKSSEEHYSCVYPNRGDENNFNPKASTAHSFHGRTGTIPTYGRIRPRSLRLMRPRRSRSDGEEYSVIRKSDTSMADSGAPPVPEKRYSEASYGNDWHNSAAGPSTSGVDYGRGRMDNTNHIGPSALAYDREENTNPVTDSVAKREPSYRFITVRESLDALRARMEAAAAANASVATTAPAPVGSAHSDSSLHYYATISEHSYEVVPSRRCSARNDDPNSVACRTVSYIDDDDDELGVDVTHSSIGAPADRSPNSTKMDSDTSSNTLMNTSIQSHAGSQAASVGSHVTLVHVGGSQAASSITTSGQFEQESRIHSRPTNSNQRQNTLGSEKKKDRIRKTASGDSSCSTGAALSIDINSEFGVDEHLSTTDHRDFNPSTFGDMDDRSMDTMYDRRITNSRSPPSKNRDGANLDIPRIDASRSPSTARTPVIVELEKLENFNVSSSNSLNNVEDVTTQNSNRDSGVISYQL